MTQGFIDHLARELDGLRESGLYKTERIITSKQAGTVHLDTGQDVINLCANNYLGLAGNPEVIEAGREGARALRLRHGVGALHLRHAGGAQRARSTALAAFSAWRTRSFSSAVSTPSTGLFETLLAPRTRHLGRAQPRLDHRRGAAVQGEALSLRQQRHGGPRSAAAGGRGQPFQADRHRRRLLDGRLSSPTWARSAIWPNKYGAMVMVDDSHAVGFVGETGAARASIAASRAGSTSSPARSARRLAAHPAATPAASARWSTGCASARGPISFPTRWRR